MRAVVGEKSYSPLLVSLESQPFLLTFGCNHSGFFKAATCCMPFNNECDISTKKYLEHMAELSLSLFRLSGVTLG